MKNSIFLVLAGLLFLGSCTVDDTRTGGEASLTFRVTAEDPFSTRADIYSSDAIQSIDDCKVYVFKSTDGGTSYKYRKTYDLAALWVKGWNSVTYSIPKSEMLENGMYRFLAVGMDGSTDYTLPALTEGQTDYTTVIATLGTATPQEIFSGLTDYTIGSSIETIRVLMSRRVAGVLGYFTNVPTTIGGQTVRYLRLSLAGSRTTVDITTNPNANVPPEAATGPSYNIFNVDLSTQDSANGIYTGTPNIGGVGKVANTTLVGAYVVPVAFTAGTTMTLSLVGGTDGATVLRSWPVLNDAASTTYSILSNHFYSLGRKLQSANTTNGNDDPTDDDLPIDFQSQTLAVNISAGWNILHQMSLQSTP